MQNQVQQRRERLLELLVVNTFASVESLSEWLLVSPLTVRRDLDALQEQGRVERLHGGARPTASERIMDKSEISFYTRRGEQAAEKQAIGRAAAQLLQKDEVIFVDASTTAMFFARAIPAGLPLTIITYSANLPVDLAGSPELQIISTGGTLHRKSLCYLGEDVERVVAQYHPRRAFLGAKGVSLAAGCTDALLPEIRLKAQVMDRVEEVVLLVDHTKLGNVGLASFSALECVSTLITDEGANLDFMLALRERGINTIVVPVLGNFENSI